MTDPTPAAPTTQPSAPQALDVERLAAALRELAESSDPEYGNPLQGLAYDDLASRHAARLLRDVYARLSRLPSEEER